MESARETDSKTGANTVPNSIARQSAHLRADLRPRPSLGGFHPYDGLGRRRVRRPHALQRSSRCPHSSAPLP
jgi:hypothetical protein